MNRVLQRLQKWMYVRAWNRLVEGVAARKYAEKARQRALVKMNKGVSRLQRAKLSAGWATWSMMVRDQQDLEAGFMTAGQMIYRVVRRLALTTS